MDFLLIATGLVALIAGGEFLVRGAVSLATSFRVSPMVIGLTLVGFGTSLPELMTSVQAAFAGSPGIAVGNVVGSNIANILLILGCAALMRPIAVTPAVLQRDGAVLALVTVICIGVVLIGFAGRGIGALLVLALATYLILTIRAERRTASASPLYLAEADTIAPVTTSSWWAFTLMLGGLAITVLGARLLVSGAISLASDLGVSDAVIGLTVVAIGTSLPELVTSIVAARKGQSDIAFGNIIGSNIFNVLGILGVTALLKPIAVPSVIQSLDIWVMLAATVALLVFAWTGWRIGRREGGTLLLGYAAYLGVLLRAVV